MPPPSPSPATQRANKESETASRHWRRTAETAAALATAIGDLREIAGQRRPAAPIKTPDPAALSSSRRARLPRAAASIYSPLCNGSENRRTPGPGSHGGPDFERSYGKPAPPDSARKSNPSPSPAES